MQAQAPHTPSSAGTARRKTSLLAVLALPACAAAAWFYLQAKPSAPDVTYTSLTGEKLSTHSLRGKVVMVNFWATSCATCIKEMPDMVRTYSKYQARGLEFVAVAMSYDPPSYVVNYAETRKLPFKVALDVDGKLAEAFGKVALTPTTFVIGKDGKILKRYVGEPDWAQLHALLDKAVAA